MAVEYLTKENHQLEEQLRQKNVGLNTQEEDQKGTNAERRDQEGPEGSNAPSRKEQQDTSHPFTTDIAPLYMVMKMQMMKERMDFMMNALRGRVSSDLDKLVYRIDSPITASVISIVCSNGFQLVLIL